MTKAMFPNVKIQYIRISLVLSNCRTQNPNIPRTRSRFARKSQPAVFAHKFTHSLAPYHREVALAARLIIGQVSIPARDPSGCMYTENWNRCSSANPNQYFKYRCKYLCRCGVAVQADGVAVQQLVNVHVEMEDVVAVRSLVKVHKELYKKVLG